MDTNVFRYFIVLAKTGNYTRAARELYMSPQGLSAAIKRLENNLDVPLFETQDGRTSLSEYGKLFYEYARRFDRNYADMMHEMSDLKRQKSGAIRLAVSIGLFNVFPRESLRQFEKNSHTSARIEQAKTLLDDDCELRLIDKSIDFALINDPVDHLVFSSIPLHKDMMFLWMHETAPLAKRKSVTTNDLVGLKIACLSPKEFKTSRNIEKVLASSPYNCTLVHTDEVVETLEMAMRENAYAITVRTHAQAFRKEGYLGIPIEDLTWGFSVAWKSDRILSEQDREFLDFLKSRRSFYC